eukprot:8350149-Heterocapsa_arctica.AAC.1
MVVMALASAYPASPCGPQNPGPHPGSAYVHVAHWPHQEQQGAGTAWGSDIHMSHQWLWQSTRSTAEARHA